MNKLTALINTFSVLLICLLVASVILTFGTGGMGNLLLMPTVAAMPDGFYNYLSEYPFDGTDTLNNGTQSDDTANASDSSTAGGNDTNTSNDPDSISAAVEEAVMGSIVKKTLSPYSANLINDSVCINNQSGAGVDISSELSKSLGFTVTKSDEPQILIYHTHTTESYMMSEDQYYTNADEPRTTDEAKNVVAVGKKIAEQLEAAGYAVVHDTTVHDYPGFTGSYTRSAETVQAALEKYPSIKIAIDVHRDSISSGESDKVAPVVTVDGREAAQVMLVMGSETGSVTGYPNWRENLRLAMKLQYLFETNYPQFARSLLLRSTKYNQNLTTGSILIEMGSDANTLDQALYSGELVGKALVLLLNSQ